MFVVMVLFNWTHPSKITELYEMRIKESNDTVVQVELQQRIETDASDDPNECRGNTNKVRV